MMFNLANILTLSRILIVPVIILLLAFPGKTNCLIAMLAFIAASLTDFADGLIARKYNLVTNLGKFLDPIADKILISSVLIMLVEKGWVPSWIAILIVIRELVVTGLRAIAADKGKVIAADRYGKLKTIMQIVALCPIILHHPWWGVDLVPLGMVLLYVALGLTIFSGWNYLSSFYKVWTD